MNNEIVLRVTEVLHNLKKGQFPREQISSQTKIIDEIGIDSLEMINLFLSLEDEFDIEIAYDAVDLAALSTVQTLAEFIESQISTP